MSASIFVRRACSLGRTGSFGAPSPSRAAAARRPLASRTVSVRSRRRGEFSGVHELRTARPRPRRQRASGSSRFTRRLIADLLTSRTRAGSLTVGHPLDDSSASSATFKPLSRAGPRRTGSDAIGASINDHHQPLIPPVLVGSASPSMRPVPPPKSGITNSLLLLTT